MIIFIVFIITAFILWFLLNAFVLKFVAKKFKAQNATYKNALMISFFEWLSAVIIGVIVGSFLPNLFGNIISWIIVFAVFNLLCKKYYLTNIKNNISIYLLSVLITVVISLIVVLSIRFFIAEPFYVTGVSMNPTLPNNTYTIIKKFNNTFNRGDIVVFKYPKDQTQDFIKRIIGLPGEKVEIKDGSVYIYNAENLNGFKLGEPYILNDNQVFANGDGPISLGSDEYYVLGDNPSASKDSRSFGPVGSSLIVGKYWFSQKDVK